MEEGSKLILCTGKPDWEYVRGDKPGTYEALSYLERLAPAVRGKNHKLKLVLSGDSHHYARFQEDGLNYITCGGGGAFLHPTHQLPKEPVDFETRFPKPGEAYDPDKSPYPRRFSIATKEGSTAQALYPDRKTSSRLTAGNLFFAFRNWKLTATLAGIYLFFTWLLDFNARVSGQRSLVDALAAGSCWDAVERYWSLVAYSPWSATLVLITGAAYYYFADDEKKWRRALIGAGHALLHAVLVTLVTCAIIRWMTPAPPALSNIPWIALTLFVAALASAFASATLIGLYLWFCLSVFGIHWGHYSSLAIQGYKSFLRFHIGADKALTIYPVGLTNVPNDRGWFWSRKERKPGDLDPHLIEPAIRIES
jgi:hypothetical protein